MAFHTFTATAGHISRRSFLRSIQGLSAFLVGTDPWGGAVALCPDEPSPKSQYTGSFEIPYLSGEGYWPADHKDVRALCFFPEIDQPALLAVSVSNLEAFLCAGVSDSLSLTPIDEVTDYLFSCISLLNGVQNIFSVTAGMMQAAGIAGHIDLCLTPSEVCARIAPRGATKGFLEASIENALRPHDWGPAS